MNLRYLLTFQAVMDCGSLTEAGRRLGISQSAVSLQIQKLEEEFGGRLINRNRHPLCLTPAGEVLRQESARILEMYERARETVRHSAGMVAGPLRISASTIPGEYLVPAMLGEFVRANSLVRPILRISGTSRAFQQVADGWSALGFVGARVERAGMRSMHVTDDEIILVGRPDTASRTLKAERLPEFPMVGREEGSGTQAAALEALEGMGIRRESISFVMVANSTESVLNAARAGVGLAFVSSRAARDALELGALSVVEVPGMRVSRSLSLVYAPERITGVLLSAFLEHVRVSADSMVF